MTEIKTIQFGGKLVRQNIDGSIEVSRLLNAKTGELGWFVIPSPTPKLIKALGVSDPTP